MRRFSFLVMMLALVGIGAKAVDFSVGNLKYSEFRVGKSVYCLGLTSSASGNSSVTTITIPGWVTYNGVTYNVEGIDATAFYQEYYLKTVVVEWGVKQIDYGALRWPARWLGHCGQW